MHTSTNTQSGSNDNHNIYTKSSKIPTSPSPFVLKYYFENTIQEMSSGSDEISKKYDQTIEKQQEAAERKTT